MGNMQSKQVPVWSALAGKWIRCFYVGLFYTSVHLWHIHTQTQLIKHSAAIVIISTHLYELLQLGHTSFFLSIGNMENDHVSHFYWGSWYTILPRLSVWR